MITLDESYSIAALDVFFFTQAFKARNEVGVFSSAITVSVVSFWLESIFVSFGTTLEIEPSITQ